jgi:cyclic dehypoxanthinyl futalosine synthase
MFHTSARASRPSLHALSAPEVLLQKVTIAHARRHRAAARTQACSPSAAAQDLEDSVRKRIWSLTKAPTEKWVDVHESAHSLGMRTTATMMFGVGETYAQRVEHLQVVRDLQDRTGGFTAWIPWTFQKENTDLDGKVEEAGGFEYLKTLAVSALRQHPARGVWVTQAQSVRCRCRSAPTTPLDRSRRTWSTRPARGIMTQEEMDAS